MRRVIASATIDGVDDETFGGDEYGHATYNRQTILADENPQNVLSMECRWGGECRVELRLTGQLQDHGRVLINGEALLYEGTSESTSDLDGRNDFTMFVPRGQTISDTQTVTNQDEGGDYANIKVTVSNILVEDDPE